MPKILYVILLLTGVGLPSTLNAAPLTEDRLFGKEFHPQRMMTGSVLTFFADKTFKYVISEEGAGGEATGTWKIDNAALLMSATKTAGFNTEAYPGFTEARCTLVVDNNTFDYAEFLDCVGEPRTNVLASGRFPMPDSAVQPGAMRMIDGTKVVFLGNKKGIATKSVMFRDKPSPNGTVIDVRKIEGGMYSIGPLYPDLPSAAILPGARVSMWVTARTEQKSRVGQWENYWLFVQIGRTSGWVFGEFVQVSDQK